MVSELDNPCDSICRSYEQKQAPIISNFPIYHDLRIPTGDLMTSFRMPDETPTNLAELWMLSFMEELFSKLTSRAAFYNVY